MQTSPNSFFIRTIQAIRPTASSFSKPGVIIEPTVALFTNYPSAKVSICKLAISNETRFVKRIAVSQPSKAYFSVKLQSKQLLPMESSEIYIAFNPQRETIRIEDEFCIRIQGQSTVIHVPIVCIYKNCLNSKLSSKQIPSNKENELIYEKSVKNSSVRPRRSNQLRTRKVSIESRNSSIFLTDFKAKSIVLFHERFQHTAKYVEEKKVKNEIYLGQETLSSNRESQIRDYAACIRQLQLRTLSKKVSTRFSIEYSDEGPILQQFGGCTLSWNSSLNNSQLVFSSGMAKIQEEIRKYIISLRFQRIKDSLKMFNEYQQREQNLHKKLRVQQYVEYYNCRHQNSSSTSEYQFDFDKNSLKHQQLMSYCPAAPVESEYRQRTLLFEIIQRIGFDNWVPMNAVREDYQQLYNIQEIDSPVNYVHLPVCSRTNRRGEIHELTSFIISRQSKLPPSCFDSFGDGISRALNIWEVKDHYFYCPSAQSTQVEDFSQIYEQII